MTDHIVMYCGPDEAELATTWGDSAVPAVGQIIHLETTEYVVTSVDWSVDVIPTKGTRRTAVVNLRPRDGKDVTDREQIEFMQKTQAVSNRQLNAYAAQIEKYRAAIREATVEFVGYGPALAWKKLTEELEKR